VTLASLLESASSGREDHEERTRLVGERPAARAACRVPASHA